VLENLKPISKDAILGIMALFRADSNIEKIDLSVGVYQDETGITPILDSVKKAEAQLIEAQETKSYVSISGNSIFNSSIQNLIFGKNHQAIESGRVSTIQTPGGSGGLCIAAHLIARSNSKAKVWVSNPSWPNHSPLLKLSGITIEQYPYYNYENHSINFDLMLSEINRANKGDLILLHGCCHNPSGSDLSNEQWKELGYLLKKNNLIPFIDLAYLGLGDGIEKDAFGVRFMADLLPEVLVVSSCSKNFGLYRERVGAVSIVSNDKTISELVLENISNIARGVYSMPPDHGAAIVGYILNHGELRDLWKNEVGEIRNRLNSTRTLFVNKMKEKNSPKDFSFIERENGMFSFLGLTKDQIVKLREDFHIYMVESSRINIAGVNVRNVDRIVNSIIEVL
jgi:aspartate aminotransferase